MFVFVVVSPSISLLVCDPPSRVIFLYLVIVLAFTMAAFFAARSIRVKMALPATVFIYADNTKGRSEYMTAFCMNQPGSSDGMNPFALDLWCIG